MCMSVPQIAVFAISISTSFGPTLGSGTSASQMPGARSFLTSAFMRSRQYAELAAHAGERLDRPIDIGGRERGGHLGPDPGLTLGDDRVGEADDVDTPLEQRVGH